MCICVHVCEWCQCGGCSCVLVRLCERGGYVSTWCLWRSEDNLGCQSSPSTLFWDRPSCVLSTAFVKLAGPTKLQKVSCLYFPSPGELQMVMVSMWLPRGFWMSRLRSSCLHDKLVPMKPFPRPQTYRFLFPPRCHLLRCSLGRLILRLPSCSSELQAALWVKSDKQMVKDARLLTYSGGFKNQHGGQEKQYITWAPTRYAHILHIPIAWSL